MKNFFKKLAFVLALAMVVTAIAPAAKASAATEPTFKYSSKVLYIGGDKTGNYGDTYRFTFKNAKGYTAAWKSSKTSVATVDAKSGNIQAVAVGKTTITATLKNGKKTVETKATVTVKQNAEKIGFGSTAKVKDMAIGDTGKVNVYRQVGTTKVWKQADKTVCTDVVKWTTSDAAVATVDKWGKVTAVAAGEATITATATQSEGSKAVVFKSYKVTVAAGLTDGKQASKDTINVTFAGDLSAVATKENVKVYSLVGTTQVVDVVKSVKFDATDKTKATITVFNDLTKGTEYVVEYADTKVSFVGADLSKEATASLKIETTEAVKGEATDVKVKAYDANGVELPGDNVNGYITLSADTSAKYYLDEASKKITIFNTGDVAEVKATFHTYTYGTAETNFAENVVTATSAIKGVDKATLAMKTVDAFTVYTNGNGGKPNFDKAATALSVSDDKGTYSVAVKCTDNTTDAKTVNSSDDNMIADDKFAFESSNTEVLVINGSTLYPVKEGSASVIVKYNKTTIGAYTVTIGAKRIASVVEATLNNSKLASGSAIDSLELKVVVKDQYGVERTGADNVEVTYAAGPESKTYASSAKADAAHTYATKFTFNGTDFQKEGTYTFNVKVDKITRTVGFTVGKTENKKEDSFKLSNANKNVDTALKADGSNTDSKDFTMDLASYTSDGYKMNNYTIYATEAEALAAAKAVNATTGTAFWAKITTPYTATTDAVKYISVSNGAVDVNPVVVEGGVATKMKTGSYTVQIFKYDLGSTSSNKSSAVTVTNLTITDTQTAIAVTKNSTHAKVSTLQAALADKDDILTLALNGNNVNDKIQTVVADDVIGDMTKTGVAFYLKNVKVAVAVSYDGVAATFNQEVAIGMNVTLK